MISYTQGLAQDLAPGQRSLPVLVRSITCSLCASYCHGCDAKTTRQELKDIQVFSCTSCHWDYCVECHQTFSNDQCRRCKVDSDGSDPCDPCDPLESLSIEASSLDTDTWAPLDYCLCETEMEPFVLTECAKRPI
jgi:hypothetical protein